MRNKRMMKILRTIIVIVVLFGSACFAGNLFPPPIDYSNIAISADALPSTITSNYLKAYDDGVYIFMNYDGITVPLFQRDKLGSYIIRFNNDMEINAVFYYPWMIHVRFMTTEAGGFIIGNFKQIGIRYYDSMGKLQKEVLEPSSEEYRQTRANLELETQRDGSWRSTAPDGTLYCIENTGNPLLISKETPDGHKTTYNLQEIVENCLNG